MLLKDKRYDLIPYFPLCFGFLAFLGYSPLGGLLGEARVPSGGTIEFWYNGDATGVRTAAFYVLLLLLIVSQAMCFLPLGQGIARGMRGHPPLKAYSINIVGSLAGILLFSLFSFLRLPSLAWFSVGLALWLLLIFFSGYAKHAGMACLLCGATLVGVAVYDRGSIWSPYYKIETVPSWLDTACIPQHYKAPIPGQVPWGHMFVYNGVYYVGAVDMSTEFRNRYPEYSACWDLNDNHNTVFKIASPKDKDVLIVAPGPGNDVASALRFGARHVDAVDIDPVPFRLGRQYHPEKVYFSPRVSLIVNDARAYFHKTRKKYDYIVYAGLDAQTLLSGMSSIRLDNFIYTRESFKAASQLLAPDGVIAIIRPVPLPTTPPRMVRMLRESFPEDPILNDDRHILYITGPGVKHAMDTPLPERMWGGPLRMRTILPGQEKAVEERLIPTDDWPFYYLSYRHIPAVFLVMALLFLILSFLLVWHAHGSVGRIRYDLLLLGAGFLLLETKGVTQMALLYGTTWFVNTVVFTIVLVVVLLANKVVAKRPRLPVGGLYVGLVASLLVSYYVEMGWLLEFSPFTRALVSSVLLGAPFFFASCVFARVFSELRQDEVGLGLGSNLIGSIVGGLAEYTTLLFGIKFLNIIALAFYALSWLVVSARRQS